MMAIDELPEQPEVLCPLCQVPLSIPEAFKSHYLTCAYPSQKNNHLPGEQDVTTDAPKQPVSPHEPICLHPDLNITKKNRLSRRSQHPKFRSDFCEPFGVNGATHHCNSVLCKG